MRKSVLEYLEKNLNMFDFKLSSSHYLIIADYNHNLIWIIVNWINNEDLKDAILDKFCDLSDVFSYNENLYRTEHYESEYTKFMQIIEQF